MLQTTTEGDGSVTYESGRLPGVLTWYMDVEHGDLAAHEAGFTGDCRPARTRHHDAPANARPRAARGGAVISRTLPQPVLYPTSADLTAGLLGKRRAVNYRPRPTRRSASV